MGKMSILEQAFYTQFKQLNGSGLFDLPTPKHDWRFAANYVGFGNGIRDRLERAGLDDWRADFAWPDAKLLVECEGGIHNGGRHVRITGYRNDCKKYNAAQLLGYRVLRYTSDMINDDFYSIMRDIKQALKGVIIEN